MRLLASDFQMAAPREIAVDFFVVDDLLDAIDGFEGRGVHFSHDFTTVALDERGHRQFHSGKDHAAVAATGAPAEGFGFEDGDVPTAFRESQRGGESAEAAADNGDVDVFRKIADRLQWWCG